jgi:hypothetical protein
MVIVDSGRAFDFLAWYRPLTISRATVQKPVIGELHGEVIIANIRLDDGVETRREFELEAELMGWKSRFAVSASEFASMDWPIEQLGRAAITFPNQRDYTRTAIQSFSMAADERCIYTHTGWREVDGRWRFLRAGVQSVALGPSQTLRCVSRAR